jgi:hypothetical protein
MTELKKKVSRVARKPLGHGFGSDHRRPLVCAFIPGNGADVDDLLELRPHGTRRPELIALVDVYRFAIRCRVGRLQLEKARAKKAKKEAARERAAIARADRKISQSTKE